MSIMYKNIWAAIGSMVVLVVLSGCAKHTPALTEEPVQSSHVQWPSVQSEVKKNPAIEAKITELLRKLSVEQKVGQLIQPELRHITADDITRYSIGSVLNGGGSFPNENKYAKIADWLALADNFYHASMSEENGRVPIPVMWGTDAVHGHNNIIGATLYPHNIALGATRNLELIRQIGTATAAEIAVTGIDWSFAPTLAVTRDDRWGRTYESYAEDPAIVKSYAGKMVEGLQGKGNSADFLSQHHVIATAKHFLADGGTLNGVDRGDTRVSEQELVDMHNAGYITALAAGAQTVMASFSSWQGLRMHGNHYLLTTALKQKMGFDGLIVGDWNGHAFVPGCSPVSCPQAINAGLDIFMAPDANWKVLYQNTLAQVKIGQISEARLNDAVARILRVKLRAGLFTKGAPSTRALAGQREIIGAAAHRIIARQAVRESLVLLKNNHHVLPVKAHSNILVTGDGANNIGKQAGGWSITWQGTGNSNNDFPGATSIYQGLATAATAAGGKVELSVDGHYQQKPDVAFVIFGEDPYAEMQGDINRLAYNDNHHLALLKKLKADGIDVIALFITGRPLWINPFINASDAFVVIWQPGTEGAGIADVVLTRADEQINHDFKGKLAFSWPSSPMQTSLNDGQPDYAPQFALGFGLTYANKQMTPVLDETAGHIPTETATRLPIFNQRVMNPWQLTLLDHLNNQLPVTTSRAGLSSITVAAVDYKMQEDARRVVWNGVAQAALHFSAIERTDLSSYAEQGAWVFDVKINAKPSADVTANIVCGTDCNGQISIAGLLNKLTVDQWHTVTIPLRCITQKSLKLDLVLTPFSLATAGSLDLSLYNIRIEKLSAVTACP